jgi:hypothetical protein
MYLVSQMFASEPTQVEHLTEPHSMGRLFALPSNKRARLAYKRQACLTKKFYNIAVCYNCHETFLKVQ